MTSDDNLMRVPRGTQARHDQLLIGVRAVVIDDGQAAMLIRDLAAGRYEDVVLSVGDHVHLFGHDVGLVEVGSGRTAPYVVLSLTEAA
ncbi:MAG: hypothetical protein ACJ73S_20755 [Mycobacteriales bacterium]